MRLLTVRLSEEQFGRLRGLASRAGVSVSVFVRRACGLEVEERQSVRPVRGPAVASLPEGHVAKKRPHPTFGWVCEVCDLPKAVHP